MTAQYNAEHCKERHDSLERVISEKITSIQHTLARIEAQTTATNGRVKSLERWQIALMTAIAVLSVTKWPELLQLFRVL
jgi:hypothetical protein